MTDKQQEALIYADKLEKVFGLSEYADEIRRLHQSEREGWRYADEVEQDRKRLHEEIEALRRAIAQPESAECDGGKCGIGGYCKQCPKTQPDVPETAFGETEPVAIKFQIYKQTPQRGRELEPINSALLPWVYDQDPSSGNTASMWVTPVATLPPQREWKGLTDDEYELMAEKRVTNYFFNTLDYAHDIEAMLKEKNGG